MRFTACPIEYRYAPMIVEGGSVKVMVYDKCDRLCSMLSVKVRKAGGYLVSGQDPGRDKQVRTRIGGISAFDAANKYCQGLVL
jgi:hypothetical protein